METKSSPKKSESPKKKAKEPSPNRCVLPEDIIMFCILTRLPVKSIIRFKSVCKPWLQLFSTPEFVKSHRAQFSSDPKNESLIFYGSWTGILSLLNPDSNEKKLTTIVDSFDLVDFVGCCNGLICVVFEFASVLGLNRKEQVIHLWNPAMKLVQPAPLEMVDGDPEIVSLGFGYDVERNDFKVVRIVCYGFGIYGEEEGESVVEVYSANSDSWTTIEVGFDFLVYREKNDGIVNGNPHWVAMVDGDDVLLCFDVTRMVFKIVPLPPKVGFLLVDRINCKLVDLNGSLGVLWWDHNFVDIEMAKTSLDILVFSDGDRIWRKIDSLGPIPASVYSLMLCLKNGNIMGDRLDGELFVFDPDNGCVDEIVIDDAPKQYSFEVYGYTESLTHIDGMIKQVTRGKGSSK